MYFVKRYGANNMNLFDNLFSDAFGGSKLLKTDIVESEDNYTLMIDLPSVQKKDISLDYNDEYLTVSVKHEENSDDSEVRYIRKERSNYSYSRSYYLSDSDKENIKAKLDNGVLTVTIGKLKQINNKKTILVE